MKIKNLLAGSISAFAGILLVILLLVNLIVVQDSFLKYTNNKHHVYKNLLMSSSELDKVTEQMVAYVKGKVDSPQIVVEIAGQQTEFFNQKEIGHLADVRELIAGLYVGMVCMAVVCVIGFVYLVKKKFYDVIAKGVFVAWGLIIGMAVVIGIVALIDIHFVIDGFHKLFLGGSTWVLNPALDRSIRMFRTDMYIDVLIVIGCIIAVVGILSVSGATLGVRRIRGRK